MKDINDTELPKGDLTVISEKIYILREELGKYIEYTEEKESIENKQDILNYITYALLFLEDAEEALIEAKKLIK